MSDIQAQFSVLRQTTDPAVADAILQLIEEGEDAELNRVNVLDFSKRTGLDEERVISGFLHASRPGTARSRSVRTGQGGRHAGSRRSPAPRRAPCASKNPAH